LLSQLPVQPASTPRDSSNFRTVVGVVILAVGRVSGAHVNPAVSLAHSLVGRLGKDMIVPYVVFQSIGALAAGLVLRVVFRPNASSHYLGSTMLSVNTALGFALETIGTFTLAFVILRVSTGERI